jgi:hypothetical protein
MMRGLVQLVVEKLHSELPHLQYDDVLFSHTVDETLGFDRELRESFGYPTSQPSVIGVLTQAQIFVKWIHMEKKCESCHLSSRTKGYTAQLYGLNTCQYICPLYLKHLYRTPPFVSLTCVSPVRLVQCCTEHLHL